MVFGLPISPLVFSIAILPLALRIVPFLIPGWETFESYSLWDPVEMNQRPGQTREDVTSRWVNVGYWEVGVELIDLIECRIPTIMTLQPTVRSICCCTDPSPGFEAADFCRCARSSKCTR